MVQRWRPISEKLLCKLRLSTTAELTTSSRHFHLTPPNPRRCCIWSIKQLGLPHGRPGPSRSRSQPNAVPTTKFRGTSFDIMRGVIAVTQVFGSRCERRGGCKPLTSACCRTSDLRINRTLDWLGAKSDVEPRWPSMLLLRTMKPRV